MNIAPKLEAEFNKWYDKEHIPALAAVPGVLAARRFRGTGDRKSSRSIAWPRPRWWSRPNGRGPAERVDEPPASRTSAITYGSSHAATCANLIMPREITASALATLLDAGSTLALIDVREPGEYNLAHIAGRSSVPRRQLESRMGRLVPFRGVEVVVCDDRARRAALAAATLERMGYATWPCSTGGVNRWASEACPPSGA